MGRDVNYAVAAGDQLPGEMLRPLPPWPPGHDPEDHDVGTMCRPAHPLKTVTAPTGRADHRSPRRGRTGAITAVSARAQPCCGGRESGVARPAGRTAAA